MHPQTCHWRATATLLIQGAYPARCVLQSHAEQEDASQWSKAGMNDEQRPRRLQRQMKWGEPPAAQRVLCCWGSHAMRLAC